MQVNGIPSPTSNSSYKTLMDGQDMTSGIDPTHLSETQPSVEALQEMTLQTSNFAAEFGQVGGGLVNFTSKSGTNEFHGSGYDYWTNRVLNAGQAYTVSPANPNGHVKPVNTNDNFDGSIGGPIILPKLYNGRNRSFFFFNGITSLPITRVRDLQRRLRLQCAMAISAQSRPPRPRVWAPSRMARLSLNTKFSTRHPTIFITARFCGSLFRETSFQRRVSIRWP